MRSQEHRIEALCLPTLSVCLSALLSYPRQAYCCPCLPSSASSGSVYSSGGEENIRNSIQRPGENLSVQRPGFQKFKTALKTKTKLTCQHTSSGQNIHVRRPHPCYLCYRRQQKRDMPSPSREDQSLIIIAKCMKNKAKKQREGPPSLPGIHTPCT